MIHNRPHKVTEVGLLSADIRDHYAKTDTHNAFPQYSDLANEFHKAVSASDILPLHTIRPKQSFPNLNTDWDKSVSKPFTPKLSRTRHTSLTLTLSPLGMTDSPEKSPRQISPQFLRKPLRESVNSDSSDTLFSSFSSNKTDITEFSRAFISPETSGESDLSDVENQKVFAANHSLNLSPKPSRTSTPNKGYPAHVYFIGHSLSADYSNAHDPVHESTDRIIAKGQTEYCIDLPCKLCSRISAFGLRNCTTCETEVCSSCCIEIANPLPRPNPANQTSFFTNSPTAEYFPEGQSNPINTFMPNNYRTHTIICHSCFRPALRKTFLDKMSHTISSCINWPLIFVSISTLSTLYIIGIERMKLIQSHLIRVTRSILNQNNGATTQSILIKNYLKIFSRAFEYNLKL